MADHVSDQRLDVLGRVVLVTPQQLPGVDIGGDDELGQQLLACACRACRKHGLEGVLHPSAMFAPADVQQSAQYRVTVLLRQQASDEVAAHLVILQHSMGYRAWSHAVGQGTPESDLLAHLLRNSGQQPVLAAEKADDGLAGCAGDDGDVVQCDLVHPALLQGIGKGVDDAALGCLRGGNTGDLEIGTRLAGHSCHRPLFV